MAKTKIAFVCTECGAEHGQWQGQCSACKAWNTLTQINLGGSSSPAAKADFRQRGYAGEKTDVQTLADIDLEALPRFSSSIGELDRVLGGGLSRDQSFWWEVIPGRVRAPCCCKSCVLWPIRIRSRFMSPEKNPCSRLGCGRSA